MDSTEIFAAFPARCCSPTGALSYRLVLKQSGQYPAVFGRDDGAFVVSFPDIPEAITKGARLRKRASWLQTRC
ncbi:hypothetical protein BZM27_38575 [Paraburkholderia steynii]|uniref:Uncharacterized protein n=1 Tax=Paraburkholderia steynii TaxID=1245441 RepID=A0A4R0XD25_9BURK|nr:hypothetical protein BZM27_38575 [Paraburkholderia steynii]